MTTSRTCVCSIAVVEAETFGDPLIAWIPKYGVAAADQHRHIRRRDSEPIEELLRFGVAVEIDVVVGMAVAGQKLLDPQRTGAVHRSDQHDVTKTAGDQLNSTQDERPHEDLAQLGVGLHDSEQLLAIELDHLTGLGRTHARQCPPPGDHRAFARELTAPVNDDEDLVVD